MAIIGEGGIKHDSDASSASNLLERHSQPNRGFSHGSNGSSSMPNGLSKGSGLKNSPNVAKPQQGAAANNPLQKAAQKKLGNNGVKKPSRGK